MYQELAEVRRHATEKPNSFLLLYFEVWTCYTACKIFWKKTGLTRSSNNFIFYYLQIVASLKHGVKIECAFVPMCSLVMNLTSYSIIVCINNCNKLTVSLTVSCRSTCESLMLQYSALHICGIVELLTSACEQSGFP